MSSKPRFLSFFAPLPLVAFVACSSTDPDSTSGPSPRPDDSDAGSDATTSQALSWSPCDLKSEGGGPPAECTTAKVPLRAGVDDGQTIDVHVKRFHPKGGKSLRQMWMLQGGPGGSAYAFEGIVDQIATRYPDVDFYLPDHRGTGKSSRIGCAAEGDSTPSGFFIEDTEWPACLEDAKATLGDRLAAFTTTNAANDIGVLIERARQPDQKVFVYGVSYGTYWANRYLQLFPQQVDGVVLDSLAAPGSSLARQDEDGNEAAKDFFTECAKDSFCASKLGPDPWARAQALFTNLKAGHCPAIAREGIPTHVALRRAFGNFLMSAELRFLVPAIVYRAERCAENDVTALSKLMDALVAPPQVDEMFRQWGWVLSNNIAFSELWEEPAPTAEMLDAIRESSIASRDVTTGFDPLLGKWPAYPKDQYMGAWPDATTTPVLVIHGGLDPATLLRKARAGKEHYTKPGQHWIEVPTASHTVIASSTTTEKRSCGTMMVMSFFENPMAPDTSCLAKVVPLNFESGAVNASAALLGTGDAWE